MASTKTTATTGQRRGIMRSVQDLHGSDLIAKDGSVGKAGDLLFDDLSWTIRYVVVNTGGWLTGRKVLISPLAIEDPDWEHKVLSVILTRAEVENSPDIAADMPVSRQHQIALQGYYGWAPYWFGGFAPLPDELPRNIGKEEEGDPHLRSTKEVTGYGIEAKDGRIGHVEDFLVDDASWVIRYIVVDTRDWLPGKKVLVSTQWIEKIDWANADVHVDLTRDAVKGSPEYTTAPAVTHDFEHTLYAYYNRIGYWV